MMTARYTRGDVVLARHSGKAYVVLASYPLDDVGSFACAVRGWRGGKLYGPTRQIGESQLAPGISARVDLPAEPSI